MAVDGWLGICVALHGLYSLSILSQGMSMANFIKKRCCMSNPISDLSASTPVLSPLPKGELDPQASVAVAAIPVAVVSIEHAADAAVSAVTSDRPAVTKELAPEAQETAAKTAEAIVSVVSVTSSSSASLSEQMSVAAGVARHEEPLTVPAKAKNEASAPEEACTNEKPSSTGSPVAEKKGDAEKSSGEELSVAAAKGEDKKPSGADAVPLSEKKVEEQGAAAAARPVSSREERVAKFIEAKKREILEQMSEWKKDLHPYPAFFLLMIPGIVELAKSDAQKMIETFERKLGEATTISGLIQVLEKNIEVMASKKSKVNQDTSDKIDRAIALSRDHLNALQKLFKKS